MQNKKNYLTPKVSVVKFTVESGFAGSGEDQQIIPGEVQTDAPATTYSVDRSFGSDFSI